MDIFWEMFRLFSCEIYFKIALTTCKRYYFFNEQNTYCFDRAAQGHLPKKTHASKVVLENFTKSFFVSQSYLLLISIGFSIHFGFLWYSSFVINFSHFFKGLFRTTNILLLRHSQNNYQMWLYKLSLMCEELSY